MPISVVTPAAAEPVTVAEMKEHLRVDWDEEDTYIGDLITACRRMFTGMTNRVCVNEKYTERFENWPRDKGEILLQRAPLSTVSTVVYTDTAGATNSWASSNYTTVTGQEPGRLVLKFSGQWPTDSLQPGLPIVVTYTSGYGTSADDVPADLKLAIKAMVAHYYDNREPVVVGTIASEIPYHLTTLLTHQTVWV